MLRSSSLPSSELAVRHVQRDRRSSRPPAGSIISSAATSPVSSIQEEAPPGITPDQYKAYRAIVDKIHIEDAEKLTRRLVGKYSGVGRASLRREDENERGRGRTPEVTPGESTSVVNPATVNRTAATPDQDHPPRSVRTPSPEALHRPAPCVSCEISSSPTPQFSGPPGASSQALPRKRSRISTQLPDGLGPLYPAPILTNSKGLLIDLHKYPYGILARPRAIKGQGRGVRGIVIPVPAERYPLPLVWPVSVDQLPPRPSAEGEGSQRWTEEETRLNLEEEILAMAHRLIRREGLAIPQPPITSGDQKWRPRPKWNDPEVYTRTGTRLAPPRNPASNDSIDPEITLTTESPPPLEPTLPTAFLPRARACIDQVLLELASARPIMTGKELVETDQWGWEMIVLAAAQGGRRSARIADRTTARMRCLYSQDVPGEDMVDIEANVGANGRAEHPPDTTARGGLKASAMGMAESLRTRRAKYLELEAALCVESSRPKRKKLYAPKPSQRTREGVSMTSRTDMRESRIEDAPSSPCSEAF